VWVDIVGLYHSSSQEVAYGKQDSGFLQGQCPCMEPLKCLSLMMVVCCDFRLVWVLQMIGLIVFSVFWVAILVRDARAAWEGGGAGWFRFAACGSCSYSRQGELLQHEAVSFPVYALCLIIHWYQPLQTLHERGGAEAGLQ
jgi:hypothetical protein